MTLSNDDLELIATVHGLGKELADESIARLIEQAKEANRKRDRLDRVEQASAALIDRIKTLTFGGMPYAQWAELHEKLETLRSLVVTALAESKP